MKHLQLFEQFINEKYSRAEIKKLKEFAEEVSDEIYSDYYDEFDKEELFHDEFTPEEMYDYISNWGEGNDMSAKEVMAEFVWQSMKSELGLR